MISKVAQTNAVVVDLQSAVPCCCAASGWRPCTMEQQQQHRRTPPCAAARISCGGQRRQQQKRSSTGTTGLLWRSPTLRHMGCDSCATEPMHAVLQTLVARGCKDSLHAQNPLDIHCMCTPA